MKRLSLVLMMAAMLVVMGLTAAPASAAESTPGAGDQIGGVCGGRGSNVGAIVPSSVVPSSIVPSGRGCSSGCSRGRA